MKTNQKKWYNFRKIISIICLILPVLILYLSPNLSLESILSYSHEYAPIAALVIWMVYAVKSILIFFPLIVIEIAVGNFFEPLHAIFINLVGISIVLTVPYFIGKHSGSKAVTRLTERFPKFKQFTTLQQKNAPFLCFFLRAIHCLPGDLVSMYLGATNTPYLQNVICGALGLLPGMILATIMGNSIRDSNSPAFWISLLLIIIIAVVSTLVYYFYQKKREDTE